MKKRDELTGAYLRSTFHEVFTDTPALYREFADTPLTNEGIVSFSSKYGTLGYQIRGKLIDGKFRRVAKGNKFQKEFIDPIWGECLLTGREANQFEAADSTFNLFEESEQIRYCESVRDWLREIQLMRLAIALWEGVKQNDEKMLSSFMKHEGDWLTLELPFNAHPETHTEKMPYGVFTYELIHMFENFSEVTFGRVEDDDILLYPYQIELMADELRFSPRLTFIALILLRDMTNLHIEGLSPYVEMTNDGRLEVAIKPDKLIQALWFQFAQAVELRKNYKACSSCGNWFEVSKYGSRRDKKYCSARCRQAAYDARQRAAKRQ